MDVTVIVTTWGTDWAKRGFDTAEANDAAWYHLDDAISAGAARNAAVVALDPQEWICFLDADDSLGDGYLDAMSAAYQHDRQLLTPALALGARPAECYGGRDIVDGINPCPIGTLIHRELFDDVGGFWDERAWEDWSLFRRCVLIGADIRFVHDAVYHATHDHRGRNSTVTNPRELRTEILASHAGWLRGRP
jgi:glycosyltransferase involved in cell wall biosynthesis